MTVADIPAGLRLCRASGWNQLEDDWRSFLAPPESAGWIAEKDGAALGTVACLRYGSAFTWISMMLVAPEARRAGIGSGLMATVLDALREEQCLRLDATPAGEPLYRRFGFEAEYPLVRLRSTGAVPQHSHAGVRAIEPGDFDSIFANDRAVFGADRSALLRSLFRRAPELACITHGGYCFGRPGYIAPQLGPIVAESEEPARSLVTQCLRARQGSAFAIDVPQSATKWIEWLESAGFQKERPFLRMCRGAPRPPKFSPQQFAIAGPEFG